MDIGASEIRDWHINKNGWSDIGYHYVNRRNGLIEIGRPIEVAGAHVKGHNYDSIGICMVGGVNDAGKAQANFTEVQYAGLYYLLKTLNRMFPGAAILGHRDMSPDLNHDGIITPDEWMKECPCFDVGYWWSNYKPSN